MAINYSIQAEVVDITTDSPKADDVFLVDTNVWYWMTYPNATSYVPSQLANYPGYLNKALTADSKIHHSGLSLAELSHLIEKTEREIYERSNGTIRPKEYRHNLSGERSRVASEIKAAWCQVVSLADPLAVTIDDITATAALNRLQTEKLDGYDLFILESMKNHGIVQVITDDGDFATVSGIQVFTANRNVIAAAKNQGKLKIR
ncbi:MAG: PIN domain-containing protein [Deltaproteobacteria bacterium]|jgi:predicted nucleic acid-binding protein|nr:PIN domain-containing protein [Deltaproteobacteria bacterium]